MSTLSYSYSERVVWVDELGAEPHPMVHDLCGPHADRLSVPLGWQRRDRRASAAAGDPEASGTAGASEPPRAMVQTTLFSQSREAQPRSA